MAPDILIENAQGALLLHDALRVDADALKADQPAQARAYYTAAAAAAVLSKHLSRITQGEYHAS